MERDFEFNLLWNDEYVCKLRISAWNGRFGGTAEVYIPVGGLSEMAMKLDGFPHSTRDERELVFGAFGPQSAGGAVKMRFYCKGAAGHAFVETWIEADHNPEDGETAHFSVSIEPNSIDAFVSQLKRLGAERSGIAHLNILVAR